MAIFVRSKAEKPTWLDEVRQFCRDAGIHIMGWGPDLLTVEAKSRDRAQQIASQRGQFGLKVVESEDNADAGMLDLSKNPAAVQAKIAAFDISKRRWDEQIVPLVWAVCSLLLIRGLLGDSGRYPRWVNLPLGFLSLFLFFWDGTRIWGWRLELLPDGLRVRRRFRWSTIPWGEISTIATAPRGRSQEAVLVHLASRRTERLGTFNCAFARNLRDRLRHELAQHQPK